MRRYEIDPTADVTLLQEALPSPDQPIEDMAVFVDTLHRVGLALPFARLPDGFNYVYHYLSNEIVTAIRNPEDNRYPVFENPEIVEHTAGIFGEYYFSPLRIYGDAVQSKNAGLFDHISQSWQRALLEERVKRASPVLQFFLGMVTHITADLPRSLWDSEVPEAYHADFTDGVGKLILKTTTELAPELVPGHPWLRSLLVMAVTRAIAIMRETAWNNYERLKIAKVGERSAIIHELDTRAARNNERIIAYGPPTLQLVTQTERLVLPSFRRAA